MKMIYLSNLSLACFAKLKPGFDTEKEMENVALSQTVLHCRENNTLKMWN